MAWVHKKERHSDAAHDEARGDAEQRPHFGSVLVRSKAKRHPHIQGVDQNIEHGYMERVRGRGEVASG